MNEVQKLQLGVDYCLVMIRLRKLKKSPFEGGMAAGVLTTAAGGMILMDVILYTIWHKLDLKSN